MCALFATHEINKMRNEINDIGNLFKDSFEGYVSTPSASVWNSIKHKLWLKSFLAFSINSFNVYYAAIITAAIIVSGITVFTDKAENTKNYNESLKVQQTREIDSMDWLSYKNNYYKLPSSNNNTKINRVIKNKNLNSINENNTNNFIVKSNSDKSKKRSLANNSLSKETVIDNSKSKIVNKPNIKKANKSSIEPKGKINKKDAIVNTQKSKLNKQSIVNSQLKSADIESENILMGNNEETVNGNSNLNDDISNPDKELNKVNETFYDTVIVTINDTVLYVDTVAVYDTIRYKEPDKKHKKKKKSLFDGLSLGIFTGIENSSFNYNTNTDTLGIMLTNSTSLAMSYSLGANVTCDFDKWKFQTGISYLQLNENFNYTEEINTIDTTASFWEYTPLGYTHSFDTVGYQFQIDTLNGDTFFVYVPMIIDSIIMVYDSSQVYQTESNNSTKNYNIRNKYTYLNIPLMFGYSFYDSKKLTLTGKLGGNIGILLNAKGKSFSLVDNKSVIDFDKNSLPFLKTNISWLASINMYIKLEKYMGIYIEPYFRGNLNSMFDNSHAVGLKANAIGLNAGFRFYL